MCDAVSLCRSADNASIDIWALCMQRHARPYRHFVPPERLATRSFTYRPRQRIWNVRLDKFWRPHLLHSSQTWLPRPQVNAVLS